MLPIIFLLLTIGASIPRAAPKSTIEPCDTADTCSALVGYTLYTDLKVSEVASLFAVDPISLLLTNAFDISVTDVNHILPSQLFLKIPISCSCVEGIRKSVVVLNTTRHFDNLTSISAVVYGGLVSADQIVAANPKAGISDSSVIQAGTQLSFPLPCMCFNNTDNNIPAVYMSYAVSTVDNLTGIANTFSTTVTDLENVNALANSDIEAGDILAIPLSACASSFPSYAKDYGLVVPSGSYAIAAGHCVQCNCGPASRNFYCMPASLGASCSSMQCKNSSLMIGNITAQQSVGGCNVASCDYNGFVNGSISTTLSTSLQASCPGSQQFPRLNDPPTVVPKTMYSPAPSPSESGGIPATNPRPHTMPSSGAVLGFPPAGGPTGSIPGSSGSLTNHLTSFRVMLILGLVVGFVSSMEL